jgi:hypothetical protein
MEPSDLKSRAGQLLYRELPEELRYRDKPPVEGEFGDLEAYLHGFGHLLDLIRGTTEQAYADAFAEPADNGREIQGWLIPYLAELVGAELRAPDPQVRRRELNETVAWFKSKGSLESVDAISDVVSGAESVVVEGWRRTLTTPRMSLPPFNIRPDASARGGGIPRGTPDIRFMNRAVVDQAGSNPLFALDLPQRDQFARALDPEVVFWRPFNRRGAPCFAGAYDDTSLRTPDLRGPEVQGLGPHPARALIHVRPPEGFFARGINGPSLAPTVADLQIDTGVTQRQTIGPEQVFRALGLLDDDVADQLLIDGRIVLPDRIIVSGDLNLAGDIDIAFEGLMFTGSIGIDDADTRVSFSRCAVERLVLSQPTTGPAVIASDCLFNSIRGGVGFAQLVYCTVLEDAELTRLWASDCIFNGPLPDLDCTDGVSCIRYSRVPDLDALAGCAADKAPSNTDDDPNFIRLWFEEGDSSVQRPALFGEPGAGVLNLTTSEAIRSGAEDEGEMGAYHHMFHAARIRALRLKLTDYLPLGQEIAIRYDPYLFRPPAQATRGESES